VTEDATMKRYLARVDLYIRPLTSEIRKGIIEELRSSIQERITGEEAESIETVIKELGPPDRIADRYIAIHRPGTHFTIGGAMVITLMAIGAIIFPGIGPGAEVVTFGVPHLLSVFGVYQYARWTGNPGIVVALVAATLQFITLYLLFTTSTADIIAEGAGVVVTLVASALLPTGALLGLSSRPSGEDADW